MLKGIKKRFTRKKRTTEKTPESGNEQQRAEQKANTNSTSETTSNSTTAGAPVSLPTVPKPATASPEPASSGVEHSATRRALGQEVKGTSTSRQPPLRPAPPGPESQTEISDTSVISSIRSEDHQGDIGTNMATNEINTTVENGGTMQPPVQIETTAGTARPGPEDDGNVARYEDAPDAVKSYDAIPVLKVSHLQRGGVTMETQAVGRVQFGIPPETIKDSMRKGYSVPAVYIVPVERFCREMGPALGINLAEFEFPCYYNFFIRGKRCTLVVDSDDAERNIRRVFSETLLGPAQFRRETNPIPFEEEDFAPEFPREKIPDLSKELRHFRIMPGGKELNTELFIEFRHFETPGETGAHEKLGIPPPCDTDEPLKDTSSGTASEAKDSEEGTTASRDSSKGVEAHAQRTPWTYSQARWIGDVATVWPQEATKEQIEERECKRVEIFKMPGGTEYILHDIDENNHIVGKARFFGHVKVSESMAVAGFGGHNLLDDEDDDEDGDEKEDRRDAACPNSIAEDDEEDDMDLDDDDAIEDFLNKMVKPPTFHPPSFGVTVLGNSHGFDKEGSVSGYVLWINGRGVMIDPPPYSSATLEREGIRPRTIVGIILTHCHADHDAGAFQKVLTGSPVSVITTPTIYKSFIRKYAALSALSPALLRHSHRHKPAIIGRPLRFQGATFHFTYTLHSIPCVGFKVEWRGRSMVFTGDHFNSPPDIDKLQEQGVLSRGRAGDLRNLPLQETDLLLHEAGIPPLHTPLEVLMSLPQKVKRRLIVVHTSALPDDSELNVAPTGTQGTIRLDQLHRPGSSGERGFAMARQRSERGALTLEDDVYSSPWSSASNEYGAISEDFSDVATGTDRMESSFAHIAFQPPGQHRQSRVPQRNSLLGTNLAPPLVSLRPASSTDAWFILNLLSAVPFLTSLSYASTMEVLETARVDAYCKDDVVVPSSRRNHVLCVVWEGTCVEREKSSSGSKSSRSSLAPLFPRIEENVQGNAGTVWHAGDWTGPIALQPERRLSGDSALHSTHDIVAMSTEGVKVITVEFSDLHAILKSGSPLYRKYLERKNEQKQVEIVPAESSQNSPTHRLLQEARKNLNVLELLNCNSALRKLSAVQKRHLESLAEGPVSFQPGERLWRAGAPVDRAFIVVAGTASFVPKRRNAGSVGLPSNSKLQPPERGSSVQAATPPTATMEQDLNKFTKMSLGESMRQDAIRAMQELGNNNDSESDKQPESSLESGPHIQMDTLLARHAGGEEGLPSSLTEAHDYVKLSREFQKRADFLARTVGNHEQITYNPEFDGDDTSEGGFSLDFEHEHSRDGRDPKDRRLSLVRRRSSRARFANKVLGRLYSRRAFTGGLIFSRGHFLGDVSTMVAGLLNDGDVVGMSNGDDGEGIPNYGFGGATSTGRRGSRRESVSDMVIHEQEGGEMIVHSSTLTAGKEGCVVLVFQKPSLIPFLDEYPGLLLSLLGTQVVV